MTKLSTEWLQTVFFENNNLNKSLLFGKNSLNLKMGLLSADFSLLLMKGIEKNLARNKLQKLLCLQLFMRRWQKDFRLMRL